MEQLKKEYKKTEVGVIPEDWDVQTLGNITTIITNGFVGTATTYYSDALDSVLYIQGYNVEANSFKFNGIKRVTLEFHKEHQKSSLKEGDLLTIQTGDVGLTTIVPKELEGSNCHALIISRFKPNKIYSLFFAHYFNSYIGRSRLKELETGTTMKHLNVGDMLYWKVPVPPTITEQKAIADALTDVDELITNLEKLIAKKKAIKQGAMQQLLTPPHKGGKRLEGFSGDWVEVTFDSLCKIFTKQTGFDYSAYIKPSLIQKPENDALPFIQNKDFNNKIVNYNTDYYIPRNIALNFPKILLDEKCFLISISGSIGNVGVFQNERMAFIGGAIAIAKFKDKELLDWVLYYLNSDEGQNKLFGNVKSGSHQNLILDDIRKIIIPIPSKEERNIITAFLDDIENDLTHLQIRKNKYEKVKQGMMQELLTGKTRLI